MNTKSILLILSVVLISACSSVPTGKDRRLRMQDFEIAYNKRHPEEAHIEGMVGQKEYEEFVKRTFGDK